MASQLQLRRGTTLQHAVFIGAPGEVTVDTDKKTTVVHDGTTAGGFPLLSASGGTMTGPVSMGGSKITDLATPTAASDAASKGYVDGAAIDPSNLTAGALPVGVTVASANIVNGAVDATKLASDSITNTQIKSNAAIAGTKIDPDFGAQAVDTTGNVTASRLVAADGSFSLPSITFTGDGNTGIFHPLPDTIAFCEGSNEIMRINSDGDLIVNNTTPVNVTTGTADGFTVLTNGQTHLSRNNGIPLFLRRRAANGKVAAFYRDTTEVGYINVTTTATAYSTSSDYRLKENPTPMTGALDVVAALKPVDFTWKFDGSIGRGFIAHELQAVAPEAVTGEKDAVDAEGKPEYQGVDASKLVPILVAAIQELSAKVAALEASA